MLISPSSLSTCLSIVRHAYPSAELVLDTRPDPGRGRGIVVRAEHEDVPEARGEILAHIHPGGFILHEPDGSTLVMTPREILDSDS
jgi:hypothetical protein